MGNQYLQTHNLLDYEPRKARWETPPYLLGYKSLKAS